MSRIFVRKIFHKLLSKYLWQSLLLVKWHTEFLDSGRKSWTLDSGCWTLNAGLWMLDSGQWTLDSGFWMLDSGLWTLVPRLWTLNARRWMLDIGCYTLDVGLWTLDTIIDFFRTKSEGSYWFCLIKLLKILWAGISKDLIITLAL